MGEAKNRGPDPGRVMEYFRDVAGVPPRTVWMWGENASIMAWAISHLFFVLRCLSPLQHLKCSVRRSKRKPDKAEIRKGVVEFHQRRTNFEARHTEIYFLVILALSVSLLLLPLSPPAILHWLQADAALLSARNAVSWAMALILLIETLTWVNYYLVWRNFAEPGYTLYHPAEYFVLLPVVLLVQCIAIAILGGDSVARVVFTMGDVRDGNGMIGLLGQYYFVVIIANLLSMFPATRFKAPTAINIIGAGDVVANRMVPALLGGTGRLTANHLQVLTTEGPDDLSLEIENRGVPVFIAAHGSVEKREVALIERILASGAPTIVASPSESHFRYVLALNVSGQRYAVEKPLSVLPQEIDVFVKSPEVFRDRMFALSYYGLEKALPLTYLLTANYHYQDFLEISGPALTDPSGSLLHIESPKLLERLGPLRSVRIDLIEGFGRSPRQSRRTWTEENGPAGLAFETMIHPLIVAHKLLVRSGTSIRRFVPTVTKGASMDAATAGAITYLGLKGSVRSGSGQIELALHCGKYAKKEQREGIATFEHGEVKFDFDKMNCIVEFNSGKQATIVVRERYRIKYAIQMELVSRFFASGWTDVRYDDFSDQMAVLAWLQRANLSQPAPFTYGSEQGFANLEKALA